jgi:hypothetical protein
LSPCQISRPHCPEGAVCIGPASEGDYGLCYPPCSIGHPCPTGLSCAAGSYCSD